MKRVCFIGTHLTRRTILKMPKTPLYLNGLNKNITLFIVPFKKSNEDCTLESEIEQSLCRRVAGSNAARPDTTV